LSGRDNQRLRNVLADGSYSVYPMLVSVNTDRVLVCVGKKWRRVAAKTPPSYPVVKTAQSVLDCSRPLALWATPSLGWNLKILCGCGVDRRGVASCTLTVVMPVRKDLYQRWKNKIGKEKVNFECSINHLHKLVVGLVKKKGLAGKVRSGCEKFYVWLAYDTFCQYFAF